MVIFKLSYNSMALINSAAICYGYCFLFFSRLDLNPIELIRLVSALFYF